LGYTLCLFARSLGLIEFTPSLGAQESFSSSAGKRAG
jgi:hypothetical protein